ncbi:hypothetical protein L596_004496 [Steinernema carpocapsae]|uniref:BED-type domain-containing protein n=1 Tax=Steinernema carpocapsae TaxID=34508 RepID=A0A4U8UZK4_STECR|nr:hypothetical protein L596_004496 [Steinernema carpocapsae]
MKNATKDRGSDSDLTERLTNVKFLVGACFEASCFGVCRLFVAICRDFSRKMAPRSTVYDFFEEIDAFFKCKKCDSQLKKPDDRSTGTLRKHAKTHGDIETKREVETSDGLPPRKQIKLDFSEDSKSRNEKILRFSPPSVSDQVGFFGSDRIGSNFRLSDPDRIQVGSDPPSLMTRTAPFELWGFPAKGTRKQLAFIKTPMISL